MKLTRTQWNILANLLGQSVNAALAFLFVPWLVRLLGREAYGVVGFHVTLQLVISVFDFGISVAANRELARLSDQPTSAGAMRSLVARLQAAYWLLAFAFSATLFIAAPMLAEHWLRPVTLDPDELIRALRLMALALGLQWPTILYAACVNGLQRQVPLNVIQIAASLGRFPLTVLLLAEWSPTLDVYFCAQAGVSLLHTASVAAILWSVLPTRTIAAPEQIDWRKLTRFAVGVGVISALTLVLTQFDKVLLSKLLPLEDFSNYALAFTLVGGLGLVSIPISAAVFPRFSQLAHAGATDDLRQLYHHAAQLLSALLLPLGVTLAFFADTALYVWTGNEDIARAAAPILRLLAIAATIYNLLAVPLAQQYGLGQTRLLVAIYGIAVIVFVPLCWALADWQAGIGAASACVLLMVGMLTIAMPLMHRCLGVADLWRWYGVDVLLPLAPVLAVNASLSLLDAPTTRWTGALLLAAAVLASAAGSLLVVPVTHHWRRLLWRR